jgi:hypothetical protein
LGITDDGGIALLDASDHIIDQVGMSIGSAYKEGIPLSPFPSSNKNQSYARLPNSLSEFGGHKNGTDTDNNASDFLYNDGTSSPENTVSPTIISLHNLTAQGTSPISNAFLAIAFFLLMVGSGLFYIHRRTG